MDSKISGQIMQRNVTQPPPSSHPNDLLTVAEIEAFLTRLAQHTPHPKTELFYTNPYTLLVAVVLSAQSTDAGVNKVTPALFQYTDTPEKMVALGEEMLRQKISSIGLYRNKAKHIIQLSKRLLDVYGGQVPEAREDLETLPGVGRKTAQVVRNVIFDQPTIPVDTHIFRVANRTGLGQGKTPLEVELSLVSRIPEHWLKQAHHLLILHGRYICKARQPLCHKCPVKELCFSARVNSFKQST